MAGLLDFLGGRSGEIAAAAAAVAAGIVALLLKYSPIVADLTEIAAGLPKLLGYSRRILKSERSPGQRFGGELFEERDFVNAATAYVEPDFQDEDPNNLDSVAHRRVRRRPLFEEIERLLPSTGHKYIFLLADSGMGKTAFVLNYYLRHRPRGKDDRTLIVVPLGKGRDVVDPYLRDTLPPRTRHNTIVVLDALDEDSDAIADHVSRIRELERLCRGCRNVMITCRTQFFRDDNQIPIYTDDAASGIGGAPKAVRYARLYLAPFTDAQAETFLNRRFPSIVHRGLRRRALDIVRTLPDLKVRPLILANIESLVKRQLESEYLCQIYEAMVQDWLDREIHPRLLQGRDKEPLERFSERLAIYMLVRNKYEVPAAKLERFAIKWTIKLEEWKLRGRSLLTRDAHGNYRFAHRSFIEYFVARSIANGRCRKRHEWSLKTRQFVSEMIRSTKSPVSVPRAWLEGIDLTGSTIPNAVFRRANLRAASFAGASAPGSDFRHALLKGAKFTGANLEGAQFEEAELLDTDFTAARVAGATFGGATFDAVSVAQVPSLRTSGADLTGSRLTAEGLLRALSDRIDLTGFELSEMDLRTRSFQGALLSKLALRGCDLRRVGLQDADLTSTDLSAARLDGANVVGAHLKDANLTGAVLDRADLTRADLTGARLSSARLLKVIVQGATFGGAVLDVGALPFLRGGGADLAGARLEGQSLVEADLCDADLSDLDLSELDLSERRLDGVRMIRARARSAIFAKAHLPAADLTAADFADADLSGADLSGANLESVDLSNANLADANMSGTNLTDARLGGARFHRVVLRGAYGVPAAMLRQLRAGGANVSGLRVSVDGLDRGDLVNTDLSGADLSRAHLAGFDLSGSDLTAANLEAAELSAANLSGCALIGATMCGAILRDANLTDTDLTRADLTGADLTGAVLSGALLSESQVRGAKARGIIGVNAAVLRHLWAAGADYQGAKLTPEQLDSMALTGANLEGVDLSGVILRGFCLSRAKLRQANLRGADLGGADLSAVELTSADLQDAILARANLTDAVLIGADLRNADFSNTTLTGAALENALVLDARFAGATGLGRDTILELRRNGANVTGIRLSQDDLDALGTARMDLSGFDLSGLDLRHLTFDGLCLRRAILRGAILAGIDLADADFSGAVLADADLSGVRFGTANVSDADVTRTVLSGVELSLLLISRLRAGGANLRGARLHTQSLASRNFVGADLSDLDLGGLDLRSADLTGATLRRAAFRGSTVAEAHFRGADIREADFRGAILTGADFVGANSAGALFDEGIDPIILPTSGDRQSIQAEGELLLEQLDHEEFSRFALTIPTDAFSETLKTSDGSVAVYFPRMLLRARVRLTGKPGTDVHDVESAQMATTHGTVHALPFAPGALFELRGEVSMLGFRFQSSAASPLLFVVARDGRFVHMGGEGVVSSGGGLCTVLR